MTRAKRCCLLVNPFKSESPLTSLLWFFVFSACILDDCQPLVVSVYFDTCNIWSLVEKSRIRPFKRIASYRFTCKLGSFTCSHYRSCIQMIPRLNMSKKPYIITHTSHLLPVLECVLLAKPLIAYLKCDQYM